MVISSTIKNNGLINDVTVTTNGNSKTLNLPGKPGGGSALNGGELLFTSLAVCFCNDLYREAAKRNMNLNSVEVSVSGEFGKEGEPGFNISYTASVDGPYSRTEIDDLINYVDQVAEIHNTLRKGATVVRKA